MTAESKRSEDRLRNGRENSRPFLFPVEAGVSPARLQRLSRPIGSPPWLAHTRRLRSRRGLSKFLPVSLAEIKNAVEALSAVELTELAAFIRERDSAAWDRQIDSDFSDDGRLNSVAEEIRTDIRAGRLQDLP